ncbi:hypothetical protein LshimejAT787_0904170 [Lyophyllum shimeji]|uniref:Uncharacterized protein n=1 Tax=Lyophyllum shimeji TaxID=47721 RepID=A0A9P3UQE8_LYOSH|nr:hypothetical protein LshimejAT787_0904170 [Lyophyllum shimeji]
MISLLLFFTRSIFPQCNCHAKSGSPNNEVKSLLRVVRFFLIIATFSPGGNPFSSPITTNFYTLPCITLRHIKSQASPRKATCALRSSRPTSEPHFCCRGKMTCNRATATNVTCFRPLWIVTLTQTHLNRSPSRLILPPSECLSDVRIHETRNSDEVTYILVSGTSWFLGSSSSSMVLMTLQVVGSLSLGRSMIDFLKRPGLSLEKAQLCSRAIERQLPVR